MKKIKTIFKPLIIPVLAGLLVLQTSCRKNLLEQDPTTELAANAFWKTEADATTALMGAYMQPYDLFSTVIIILMDMENIPGSVVPVPPVDNLTTG